MNRFIRIPLCMLLLFTLLLGGIYPLLVTALAQLVFPSASKGSLIVQNDKVVGSQLLGQHFTDPKYFWGRPSATTPPYNPAASGASNLAPGNPALATAVKDRVEALQKHDPKNKAPVPIDLVTASGSGLDPDISLAAAQYQAERVARHRRMPVEEVRALIERQTVGDVFSGRRRVNVLLLNMALDKASGSGLQDSANK